MKKVTKLVLMLCLILSGAFCHASGMAGQENEKGKDGTPIVIEVFPEAVRTDPQNRFCIDYQSVVTILVEAVKEQQREIEHLESILRENGLLNSNK